ncbi:MAG: tripartite tricarboxylate transporter substrate binding protein [Burkholderiaceae bacterium]
MDPKFPSPGRISRGRRRLIGAGTATVASAWLPGAARAQAWPGKPIRIIAAQAPGSSNDATARAFGEYFSTQLGVPVSVENRPGGVGMIAAETVARSTPDGTTFLLTLHSNLAQAPVLLKRPPIDPNRDLVPIGSISTGVGPIVVKKDLPVTSTKELIELARKRPVSVGNYAIGSGWHIIVVQLAKLTGAQFDLVNYKGTGQLIVDLAAGQIDVGCGSLAGLGAALQRGAIRAISITTGARSSKLPGVPTLVEDGFTGPAFEHLQECNMLLGPAGTPREVVARLGQLISESVEKSTKVKQVRETLGSDDVPLVGDALARFIGNSWPAYRALTRELGLSVDG